MRVKQRLEAGNNEEPNKREWNFHKTYLMKVIRSVDRLIDWLIGWFIDWLIEWLIYWVIL